VSLSSTTHSVVSQTGQSTLQPLQRVQNAAARLVSDTKPRDHISSVLAQLHWLPVNQRITYKLCLLIHLVHVKHCPDYLNNLVHLTADSATRPGLRSASHLSYRKPALASKFSERAFSYAGPAAWNSYLIIFSPSLTLPVLNDSSKLFCFLHALIIELCNVSRTIV